MSEPFNAIPLTDTDEHPETFETEREALDYAVKHSMSVFPIGIFRDGDSEVRAIVYQGLVYVRRNRREQNL